MSSGIFFCKIPNSICLLPGTKTIREPRERRALWSLWRRAKDRAVVGEAERGDTDNWEPPSDPLSPPACPLWVVGCGDDERGDAAQHPALAVRALCRTRQREEVSLSAGLLSQPGLCWVLLLESSQQIKHHNTHPSPQHGHTHSQASATVWKNVSENISGC